MAATELLPVDVRRLQYADATDYRALMLEAHLTAPEAFTTAHAERAAQPLSWWQARLTADPDAPEMLWGAWQADTLVGAVGLRRDQRQTTRHKATVFGLFVCAAARGQGAAQQLMTALLKHAQAAPDMQLLQLTVTQGNQPALRLYERCGFTSYGVEPMAVRLGNRYLDKCLLWRRIAPR